MNKIVVLFVVLLLAVGQAHALTVALVPADARIPEGCEVSVDIYADGALNLISMGLKITFNPAVVQVVSAVKSDAFVMDADGDLVGTTDDQYRTPAVEIDNTGGSVTMIGGRLIGTTTTGLSGEVLLGTIVFEGLVNGNSNLEVDLAKYHPNHPTDTFDNFVNLTPPDGEVDEPTNLNIDLYPGGSGNVLGSICVKMDGDADGNGVVNILDKVAVRNAFGQTCDPPGSIDADVDCNGVVNILDKVMVRNAFGQTGVSCLPAP